LLLDIEDHDGLQLHALDDGRVAVIHVAILAPRMAIEMANSMAAMARQGSLRDLINERAIAQRTLAAKIGVHPAQVSRWCGGAPIPSRHIRAVARALSVPVEAILDPETPAPPADHMEHAA